MRTAILCCILLTAMQPSSASRSVADCVAVITARAPVKVVDLSANKLGGRWGRGSGLEGEDLYLFDDGAYVFTRWSDVSAVPLIHDKGQWRVDAGAVVLSADSDVTWPAATDRRFVALAIDGETILVGLDRRFAVFEIATKRDRAGAADFLKMISLAKVGTWLPTQAAATHAQLMTESWRPEAFRERR